METWSAHQLLTTAALTHPPEITYDLRIYSERLRSKGLPVIFSLRHLAQLSGVDYKVLHETVDRKREASNYRMFAVKKRSGGRRIIHAVSSGLFGVQQFINQEVLQRCRQHPQSFAFHKDGGIRACASRHCGARWLFHFDLSDFFYDVSEVDVYRVFQSLGYRELLAFELARLCTTVRLPKHCPRASDHGTKPYWPNFWYWLYVLHAPPEFALTNTPRPELPYQEKFGRMGALPQGAPTSPMLSNLAASTLDEKLHAYALDNQLVYTRYADDLTLSATNLFKTRGRIQRDVVHIIRRAGFRENPTKSRIAGPGSKKLVLGLLVDGDTPRISRETYRRIDRLLYGADQNDFGPAAAYNGFDSAYGFHNHLSGLIAFVKDVDLKRWREFDQRLRDAKRKWAKSSSH